MAIRKTQTTETQTNFEVDNGDLQALKEVIQKYNFKDEEAALRFGLVVLLNADENNNIFVERGDQKVKIAPNLSLLKENGDPLQTK